MKKFHTKQFALCLAAVLTIGTFVPAVSAAEFGDTAGHWAEEAINTWSDRGVIQGYDGNFYPNDQVTRAQTASILSAAIGYISEDGKDFTDVAPDAWYYTAVKKASAVGAINGDDTGAFRPEDPVTREEAAVIFANAFGVTQNTDVSAFADSGDMADWAKGYVGGMSAAGYIQGSDGMYRPKDYLTRAEIVTILNSMVRTYIDRAGTFTQTNTNGGIALVKAGGVILNTIRVDGIVISPAVGSGAVTISNATTNRALLNLAPNAQVSTSGTSVSDYVAAVGGVATGGGGGGGGSASSGKSSTLSVDVFDETDEISGKLVSELMTDVEITGSTTIHVNGTLKYVSNFTEYSDDPKEQNGYFVALKVKPSTTSKMNLEIQAYEYYKDYDKNDLVDNDYAVILLRVTDKIKKNGITCTVDRDGSGTEYKETNYTINLSRLRLEPSISLEAVTDADKLFGDEVASDIMTDITIKQKTNEDNEFNVSGDLYYYEYPAFSDNTKEQKGHYLAVKLVPKVITEDMTVTLIGADEKTISKAETPEAFEEDGSLIVVWRITEALQEDPGELTFRVDYDGAGSAYTAKNYKLDIVDLYLTPKNIIPAAEVIEAPAGTSFGDSLTQADLGKEFSVEIDSKKKTYIAEGTLYYMEETGYAPGDERDNGHFVVLQITPDYDTERWVFGKGSITVTYTGVDADWAETTYTEDNFRNDVLTLPVRLEDVTEDGLAITVNFGSNKVDPETLTVDFSQVVLLEKPLAGIYVGSLPDYIGELQTEREDDLFTWVVTGDMDYTADGVLPLRVVLESIWTADGTITVEYPDTEIAAENYTDADLTEGALSLNILMDNLLQTDTLLITVDVDGDGEATAQVYTVDVSAIQTLLQESKDAIGGSDPIE